MYLNSNSLQVLLVVLLVLRPGSADRHKRQPSEWCSKFPDEEAREKCKTTEGWIYSPTCCNVKFECVDGQYNQGLRCSDSGHVPDKTTMKCTSDATCVDHTTPEVTTSTTTTARPTTTTKTTTPSVTVPCTGHFCEIFPVDEPPIYCAGVNQSVWMSSPSCCNVKYECLDGAYNQGFRCSSPGLIPDLERLKCIEDSRCTRDPDSSDEPADEINTDIVCSNASAEYLPHPSNCYKYIHCQGGIVSLLECTEGFIFSYQSQRCLAGSRDTCELLSE